jgi:hypothetical protein
MKKSLFEHIHGNQFKVIRRINEAVESGTQTEKGTINVEVLNVDRFAKVEDRKKNVVIVFSKNGKKYAGVRYKPGFILLSSKNGEQARKSDGRDWQSEEKNLELDYQAKVSYDSRSWEEPRPYGMGSAYEPMGDVEVSGVEAIITTDFEQGVFPEVEDFVAYLIEQNVEEGFELR